MKYKVGDEFYYSTLSSYRYIITKVDENHGYKITSTVGTELKDLWRSEEEIDSSLTKITKLFKAMK